MNKIIIYASIYGSGKRYAMELSRMSGIPAYDYRDLKGMVDCDLLIWFGSLYAGGISGLSKTLKKINFKRIIIVTVGIADPDIEENSENIKAALKKQLPAFVFEKAIIYSLRGAINYAELKPHHKIMMRLMYKMIIKKDPKTWTAEDRAFIETYDQNIDFVDFTKLADIRKAVIDCVYPT